MDELVSAWVHRPETPQHIALLGVFDGGPVLGVGGRVDVARVRAELTARARTVPSLGRRVVWTRPGQGRPAWVSDPGFDPAAHIQTAVLPAGAGLPTWAANRACAPLDMTAPLWRIVILDALAGDGPRFGLLVVMHHLAADAAAGLTVITGLLDTDPDATRAAPEGIGAAAADGTQAPKLVGPSSRQLVDDHVRGLARSALGWLQPRPGRFAQAASAVAAVLAARTAFPSTVAATSLPRRVGPGRRMVLVRRPLAPVRDGGHALGVTVNDLLLTATTTGMRELLVARGDNVSGMVLRCMVPAAVDTATQVTGMLLVDLPVGEPDPLAQLTLIAASARAGKTRLPTGRSGVEAILRLPVPLARALVRWGRDVGAKSVHLSVTDIRGPTQPLWLAGARLEQVVPIAALVQHVPLVVAALSYAGELTIAINADTTLHELDHLATGIGRCLDTLTASTHQ